MSQPTGPQRCVTCGEPIEYVPTPDQCDEVWHPPYWRHMDPTRLHGLLPTRPVEPGEEVPS